MKMVNRPVSNGWLLHNQWVGWWPSQVGDREFGNHRVSQVLSVKSTALRSTSRGARLG